MHRPEDLSCFACIRPLQQLDNAVSQLRSVQRLLLVFRELPVIPIDLLSLGSGVMRLSQANSASNGSYLVTNAVETLVHI